MLKKISLLIIFTIITINLNAKNSKDNFNESQSTMRIPKLFPAWVKTVAIIAPASPADASKFVAGIKKLEAEGIRVKVMPHARDLEKVGGYVSTSVAHRVADLEAAWLDPEVDLILCARGGVGSEELLPLLNWEKLRARNMPLVGYSNISALQAAMLSQKAGHPYSGCALHGLSELDEKSIDHLRKTLDGDRHEDFQLQILKSGKCSGVAFASNINILSKISNTKFLPDFERKILFLEHTGWTPEFLFDALENLRRAGIFDKCAGVVFGHITFSDPRQRQQALDGIKKFAETLQCPVFAGYPYGHELPNFAIDQYRKVSISETGILSINE